jgi:predicted RNA-binding Zn ribbon-like protein
MGSAYMIRVTWSWLGQEAALDLADTITATDGVELDLLAPEGEYERWAQAAARSPTRVTDDPQALIRARPHVLALREPIRAVLFAAAADEPLPTHAVAALNHASATSPSWLELDSDGQLREHASGNTSDRILADFARSAMRTAADGAPRLRVCPAQSCGMFYRPSRIDQHWCSPQCGARVRVARRYRTQNNPVRRGVNSARRPG